MDDHLRMIDQRRLPFAVEFLHLRTWHEVAAAISDMAVRGAPAIGAAAAFGLALAAREAEREHSASAWWRSFEEAAAGLEATRPTAVNLVWALRRVHDAASSADAGGDPPPAELARRVLTEALTIAEEDAQACAALGSHGAKLVPDGARILTHCNAGSLATVQWGTALAVIYKAHAAGKRLHVWVDETRPRQQGARLTAWELQQEGVPLTLICDTAAGRLFQTGQVDLVVVGADRIAANGDVVNKIGTYTVALLAREHGVPFYVAAPISTLDPATARGVDVPIEERAAAEVLEIRGQSISALGVGAANPAFDVTPHSLVSAIITERGILRPPYDLGPVVAAAAQANRARRG
jgi:methylthioribose-1-phosphate isomerase